MTRDGAVPSRPSADRMADRLSRLRLFSGRDYLAANPDVAASGADPTAHALAFGIREGRTLFTEEALARVYGDVARRGAPSRRPAGGPFPGAPGAGRRCTVLLHSASDEAYREVALDLARDLARLGFDAATADERGDPCADHGAAVVVAPHDFLHLGLGPLWAEFGALDDAIVMIDDPMESPEGVRSFDAALGAGGAITPSAVAAEICWDAGIPTLHFRPRIRVRTRWLAEGDLGHPLMLAAPERARRVACDPLAWDGRPLDLLCFGRESPRRDEALGRLASSLAPHRCFVYGPRAVSTRAELGLHRGAHWRICGHLSAHARLTLFVPEARLPALERRRVVVQAMAGGSAVVSTVRFAEPGFEPGMHYFHDDVRHVGALVDWLVADPDGRRAALAVRDRAFDWIAASNRDPDRLEGLREALSGRDTGGSAP